MSENFKMEKSFNSFAKKVGNPYGLEKNKEAVMEVLKTQHVENIDRVADYKQAEVVKKIAKITGLGYKTRQAVLGLGKTKSSSKEQGNVDRKRIYDEIVNKGKESVRNGLANKQSKLIDLSASEKHMRDVSLMRSVNEKTIGRGLPSHASQDNDNVKNMLREIQS
ncbi:MAG: hypothetical protein HGA36_01510 [Candidatus Moranbacteria bacterium]|nr:hypothetical protein [Candidatus Moranbacteria bacterium]